MLHVLYIFIGNAVKIKSHFKREETFDRLSLSDNGQIQTQ